MYPECAHITGPAAGIVTYKSRVVDVGALLAAGARWAAQRARLEAALAEQGAALRAARAAAASTQRAERGAQVQLNDVCAALNAAKARIGSLTVSVLCWFSCGFFLVKLRPG